jgi:hypothetical protein
MWWGWDEGEGLVTDRLGSVGGPARYYPYGQERQATPEGTEKFATYYRDATGLDYASNHDLRWRPEAQPLLRSPGQASALRAAVLRKERNLAAL